MTSQLRPLTYIPLVLALVLVTDSAQGAGLRDEAASYRSEGYRLQQRGDYAGAITNYQKAAELDPPSPALQNDLGIAFEGQGRWDRAEHSYLQALNLDPEYVEAYSNLALLFEKKNEREKAAYYWLQRAKRGQPGDPWTIRAQERLVALGAVKSTEEVAALVQDERQRVVRVIEETYAKAKSALADRRYAEAVNGFQETINQERAAGTEVYTPLAARFIEEARQALRVTESGQLGQASSTQRQATDEQYAQAKAAFEASRFQEAIAGFERVVALEQQFQQHVYTPFAQDFIAQARRFLARATTQSVATTEQALTQAHTQRRRSNVVQEELQRSDEVLRDFHELTKSQGGWRAPVTGRGTD